MIRVSLLACNWLAMKNANALMRSPRPLRWLGRTGLLPLWLADELLAPVLDRLWHAPEKAQAYGVTAVKR
jgi:hypothetical protein